jgi:hypothetical protein
MSTAAGASLRSCRTRKDNLIRDGRWNNMTANQRTCLAGESAGRIVKRAVRPAGGQKRFGERSKQSNANWRNRNRARLVRPPNYNRGRGRGRGRGGATQNDTDDESEDDDGNDGNDDNDDNDDNEPPPYTPRPAPTRPATINQPGNINNRVDDGKDYSTGGYKLRTRRPDKLDTGTEFFKGGRSLRSRKDKKKK